MLSLTPALLASSSAPPVYHFEIDPERTFTNGSLQLQFWTSGQLVGDYEAQSNPKGTRTSGGSRVSPGQNIPVIAKTIWTMETQTDFHTIGGFDLELNPDNQAVTIENYRAERLAEGPLVLDSTHWLDTAPFHTDAPDAAWSFEARTGFQSKVNLDRLRITQMPGTRKAAMAGIEHRSTSWRRWTWTSWNLTNLVL